MLERTVSPPASAATGCAWSWRDGAPSSARAAGAFIRDLAPWLADLGAPAHRRRLGAGGASASARSPTVGARVAAIRSGAAARLGEDFPVEVRPLAAEVDALIEAREAETRRARTRAADLAHGLKTPLQALMGEVERLRAAGAAEAARGIDQIAGAMRRHVDRELARARIASAGHAVASAPAAVLARLLAVIRRTGDGARLDWEIDADPDLRARIDADDLTEALGALLDNAARHATARVAVTLRRAGAALEIAIADDGPGIPESRIEELTARGARLDTAGPGSGLGLAIAQDIAEAAGGSLTLRNAAPASPPPSPSPPSPSDASLTAGVRRASGPPVQKGPMPGSTVRPGQDERNAGHGKDQRDAGRRRAQGHLPRGRDQWLGGNDRISAGAGNDEIEGGAGNDRIYGG